MKINYCIDCDKKISRYAKRCVFCANKLIAKNRDYQGKKSPGYIHGRTLKKYYCVECGKEITYQAKRCRKCASRGRNNGMFGIKGKRHSQFKDGRCLKQYYCKKCKRKITIFSGIYGSGLCQSCTQKGKIRTKKFKEKISKAFTGKNHPNWIDGRSYEPYPLGWNKTFKEQIRYRDGYQCQICGMPEVENCRKLDVHHIDYNKNNLDPKNLISLCQSCHSKTNFNRDYWYAYFMYITNKK